jgi:hypothetical protein
VLAAIDPSRQLDSPWPHQYGESRGLNRYVEPPRQSSAAEWDLIDHLARIEARAAVTF